jgi:hypothetical protein
MRNSIQTLRELSRRPYGNSAVSLRELSRRPSRHSAVAPSRHSAVQIIPTLSRWLTAQFPAKHRLSALIQIFQGGLNLSALILQVDFVKHGHAASSAPAARALAQRCVLTVKDNDKTSKGSKL